MVDRRAETATVVFTDLVGSTELRSRLGEEDGDALRRRHDDALRAVVDGHGGRVVKGLGDGIMAAFAGSADAVSAAVAMQQAVARLARSAEGAPMQIRVGIGVGDVSWEDDDCFGAPVVEASRLCAAAGAGQILCSDLVRAVARGRGGHDFSSVGELDLKGLPEPVAASEVGWQAPAAEQAPLPRVLDSSGPFTFVGRVGEWQHLERAWKQTAEGDRVLVLVSGEPGIGKTRLVSEFARDCYDGGALVLAGRCDEDLGVPYQPFVDALRHFASHVQEADLVDGLGRLGPELQRLAPDLRELAPGLGAPVQSDPETERYRLFDAVVGWLARTSATQPVLFAIDDLHWAAKPTLLLLRHLLRSSDPLRLLVVATYRDTDLDRSHPLGDMVGDLLRDQRVERLPLSGLGAEETADLVEMAAGHDLDERGSELAATLHRETAGNPFFATTVLLHLAESGVVYQKGGRWTSDLTVDQVGIPQGIRDVVGRRLSRLGKATNELLARAAVLGLEFELAVLRELADLDEDALADALEEAAGAQMVAEMPGGPLRYRFTHALVRSTLYEELSTARRILLHRRAGEVIERVHAGRLDEQLADLTFHFGETAAGGEATKAIDYARLAGDRALARHADDEAVRFYDKALSLFEVAVDPPGDEVRCDLLLALGEAGRRAGDESFRHALFEAAALAERLGDGRRMATAALTISPMRYTTAGAIDRERVATLERALALMPEDDDPIRALAMAGLGAELTYEPNSFDRRCGLSDGALAMARRLDEPRTLARVLAFRHHTIWAPTTLEERLAGTAELEELARRLDDPALRVWAAYYRLFPAVESADLAEYDRVLETARREADELGQPLLRWFSLYPMAARAALGGDLAESGRLAAEAYEIGTAGSIDAAWVYFAQSVSRMFEEGRSREVLGPVEAYPRAFAERGGEVTDAVAAARCLILAEAGQTEEARTVLEPYVRAAFDNVQRDALFLYALFTFAEAAVASRDRDAAAVLYPRLAPFASLVVSQVLWVYGPVATPLCGLAALIDRYDEAEGHFQTACTLTDRMQHPFPAARVRLHWGRALLERGATGDRDRGRKLLEEALEIARRHGYGGVEQGAASALSAHLP